MNKKSRDLILTFKKNPKIKDDTPSNETIQNSTQDLNLIFKLLKESQKEIESCKSIEKLNLTVDLKNISNDLGLIIQNSVIIDDPSFKKSVEELNQLYRDTEIQYFNKKIELLNNQIKDYDAKIKDAFKESADNLKDITGGTLFSIASVFLGISLTSALVAGVEYVKDFVILYYMTCLLIAVVTIGLAAIFMRKFDTKSKAIISIIIIISVLWFGIVFFSYSTHLNNQKCDEYNDNVDNNTGSDISPNEQTSISLNSKNR